jgi:hypothetical protein
MEQVLLSFVTLTVMTGATAPPPPPAAAAVARGAAPAPAAGGMTSRRREMGFPPRNPGSEYAIVICGFF